MPSASSWRVFVVAWLWESGPRHRGGAAGRPRRSIFFFLSRPLYTFTQIADPRNVVALLVFLAAGRSRSGAFGPRAGSGCVASKRETRRPADPDGPVAGARRRHQTASRSCSASPASGSAGRSRATQVVIPSSGAQAGSLARRRVVRGGRQPQRPRRDRLPPGNSASAFPSALGGTDVYHLPDPARRAPRPARFAARGVRRSRADGGRVRRALVGLALERW